MTQVGVLEELHKTVTVLDCLLPDYLGGIADLWKENQVVCYYFDVVASLYRKQ